MLLPLAVAVGIYLFRAHHTPRYNNALFGEHGNAAVELKAQLSTALLGLALIQLGLALWMYGAVPGARSAPRPVRRGHRALGFLAFLFSLPIAHHCLTTYGIETTSPRAAIHSFAGCAPLRCIRGQGDCRAQRASARLAAPTVGTLLVLGVALLWYTAALWALNGDSVPGFSSV
ncbi:DUF6529 family protein [Streptomyces sp. NPDC096323]|uniref:DUF6529 family protein n=1 Tax=Streptomyces sp. NPDC096323 TaxID=3155822 RepID=UPI00331BAE03